MKFNKHNFFFFLLLVSATGMAQENNFSFKRKITTSTNEAWYAIELPADIYTRIQNDFSDLRILEVTASDTFETPYLLDILDTEILKQDVELTVINQSTKGNDHYFTFENKSFRVNYLKLSFSETNYFGSVKVEGSNDSKEWFQLASNEKIFSVQNSREQYASTLVNFPLTDYKFIRLTIKSDDKLTFAGAAFRMDEIKPGVFNEIASTFRVSTDKKSKRTIVDIDLESYQPVSNLLLDIDRENDFYRQMTIEALVDSTKTERGWIRNYQTISGELITSFKVNDFNLPFTFTKSLRLTIQNFDNPPLTIKDISVAGAKVQLRAKLKNANSFLFYGNVELQNPNYEIEHFKNNIPAQPEKAILGPEELISESEIQMHALFENKLWLWGVLVGVIGLLGFFTLKMMRSNA